MDKMSAVLQVEVIAQVLQEEAEDLDKELVLQVMEKQVE